MTSEVLSATSGRNSRPMSKLCPRDVRKVSGGTVVFCDAEPTNHGCSVFSKVPRRRDATSTTSTRAWHHAGMSGLRSAVAKHQLLVFLLLAFSLSWVELLLWLVGRADGPGLNPFGPLIATLVVVTLVGGWTGFRATFVRMARVRGVGGLTWAMSLLIPVATGMAAAGTGGRLGPAPSDIAKVANRVEPRRSL